MRLLWILPLTVLVAGAGIFLRMRRRNDNSRLLTTEPVSGQWLAEARGREEQQW